MYRKIAVADRLPEKNKFVTTIDSANEHIVYRLTDEGWSMRDGVGDNSPNNNLAITHWLEEINENYIEELGQLIDSIESLACALELPMSAFVHLQQMKKLLPEKVQEFKDVFLEITGNNPWD
jgi:hypothetical protein